MPTNTLELDLILLLLIIIYAKNVKGNKYYTKVK